MRRQLLCLVCNVLLGTSLLGFVELNEYLIENQSFIMTRYLMGLEVNKCIVDDFY